MGTFFSSKKKNELVLVFDIGSSSVGGALFFTQPGGVPNMVYTTREPINLEKKVNPEKFLSLTLKALELVSKKISLAGIGAPGKVFCVLASPWYISQARNIFTKKEDPFIFNTKIADELIRKESELFKEECKDKYRQNENEIVPIELKSMQILLNGYIATEPSKQKITEMEMAIFVSMSTSEILENFKITINRYFNFQEIRFSSFTMASFAVARDMFVHQENFLLIDIGGEVTDISMIKKDILRSSISFPLGHNFLIRGVASILDCSLEEAVSLISLYKDNHMTDVASKKVEPVIIKLRDEWLKNFQESLVNISNDISIPSTIFLTVDEKFADFFTETIKSEQFNQYTLTESKFKVIFLGGQALHGVVLFKEDVLRDPFLIIESIYVNRFLCK